MQMGDGNGDPYSSSSDSGEEDDQQVQQEQFILGQKIFFTEGGRTIKVFVYGYELNSYRVQRN